MNNIYILNAKSVIIKHEPFSSEMGFPFASIFVITFEDFNFLVNMNEMSSYSVAHYENGFLFSFNCYSSFVISKLILEDRKRLFFCFW